MVAKSQSVPHRLAEHERYHIADTPTLTEVTRNYQEYLANIRNAKDPTAQGYLRAPFPPVRFEPYQGFPIWHEKHVWVPMAKVEEGAALLIRWERQAALGKIDCDDTSCTFIADGITTTAHSDQDQQVHPPLPERVLLKCEVERSAIEEGAPRYCSAVALLAHDSVWMRAIVWRRRASAPPLGLDDDPFSMAIVGKQLRVSEIGEIVAKSLTTPPLHLDIKESSDFVVATRRKMKSDVFPGWNEKCTVTVRIRENCLLLHVREPHFCIEVRASLWLNNLKTSQAEDWFEPGEAKEQTYRKTLISILEKGLQPLCPEGKWTASEVLQCAATPPQEPTPKRDIKR